MRNMVFAAAVAAVFGMGSASAADLSGGVKDTMFSEPAVVWSGGYVGISGGGGIMMTNSGESSANICYNFAACGDFQGTGGIVGGTLGYNWQIRNLVLSLEGDISWANLDARRNISANGSGYDWYMGSNIDGIATLRLRTGYAVGANLFYITGGGAFVDTKHEAIANASACNTNDSSCSDGWRTGFTVGAGYEAMITSNLSLKGEYLYIGTPTDTLVNSRNHQDTYLFSDNAQIARIGLNYRFGVSSGYQPLK